MRSRFIVVAFVVGFAGTACATAPRTLTDPSASPTPSESSEPSESPSPSPSETEPEWKTFVEPFTGITFEYPRAFVLQEWGSSGEPGDVAQYSFADERVMYATGNDGQIELGIFDYGASDIDEWLSQHSASSDDQGVGDYFTNVAERSRATWLERESVEFDWTAVDGTEVHSILIARGRYVIALSRVSEDPDYQAEIRGVFESMRERARE